VDNPGKGDIMTTQADPSTIAVVTVRDPLGLGRQAEPIFVDLPESAVHTQLVGKDAHGNLIPCQILRHAPDDHRRIVLPVTVPPGSASVEVTLQSADAHTQSTGISHKPTTEADAVARLDTGYFDLELCRGTGQGTTAAKWGIRHLAAHHDDVDLLPSGNNAIGGFYGPFFTPENGLINPPEHVIADIEVLEEGPVLHRYRFSGTIPDGLLPELRGKAFSIDWQFSLECPWFERHYHVDDFATVIDGRHIHNQITVGDEFESGHDALVFDRFASYAGVTYRGGDPYAALLARQVHDVLVPDRLEHEPRLRRFRADMGADITQASWDFYWRLFSVWEGVLDEPELRQRLALVRSEAARAINLPDRTWRIDQAGVQRRQSGWVNWGTNGENECPELPTGTTIRTAYGPFAECWKDIADGLETPLQVDIAP
jgi:hypothetical protein